MKLLDQYMDEQLARGRAYFSQAEALASLGLNSKAFALAAARLAKQKKLIMPRRGFYLILRPEDREGGAPDPVRWIDPLMNYLGIDYRISLLRAAAFHGASHQAAMVFQVIVPQQLRSFEVGRHRIQFIYQAPSIFAKVNLPDALGLIKSEAGFAKVAGIELTLLDCARYFHNVGGIQGFAQIIKDISRQANARQLAKLAAAYENSSVRRLGFLLEIMEYPRLAKALESFAKKAKSVKLLDPAIKPVSHLLPLKQEKNSKWMLMINEFVETDF